LKILVTIPHFYKYIPGSKYGSTIFQEPFQRINALGQCIASLHQNLGKRQYCINVDNTACRINESISSQLDIVICTQGTHHVLNELALNKNYFHQMPCDIDPMYLGFECRKVLRDNIGKYDYYCYLEDDLILHDPFYIKKIEWFTNCVGPLAVLQPNRFERSFNLPADKCYIDYPHLEVGGAVTTVNANYWGIDISFSSPPLAPHSGCYFLNQEQMEYWLSQPYFEEIDTSYIGALESAATQGILKTFQLYKPAMTTACFLEIEHYGDGYLGTVGEEISII